MADGYMVMKSDQEQIESFLKKMHQFYKDKGYEPEIKLFVVQKKA